ncbi:MAG: Gfo/Idh/MocA family oxidoreductase [Spirochaetales bacterium]|nr:Gfo/Idh/MocA family oxidoreductase [Spirochaetales bacterium]
MIRCAIAGTGRIGSLLENDRKREKPATHAGAAARGKRTVIVAGADPDEERLASFGRQWRIPDDRLFTSTDDMLSCLRPDILHIASTTDTHIPNLLSALNHEVPVIVLEKPVAETVQAAREALPFIEHSSSRIIVNHERRFSADYMYARSCVESLRYGRLASIRGTLFLGRTKKPRDVLWHDGTHMIDIIRCLSGGDILPMGIHGNPWSNEQNLLLAGTINRADGSCLVYLECSPFRDYLEFELDLSFEQGRIRIGNGVFEEWVSRPSPYYENFRSLMPARTGLFGTPRTFSTTGYFKNMMAHAVDLFDHPDRPSRSAFQDGIAAVDTIQKFLDLSPFDPADTEV